MLIWFYFYSYYWVYLNVGNYPHLVFHLPLFYSLTETTWMWRLLKEIHFSLVWCNHIYNQITNQIIILICKIRFKRVFIIECHKLEFKFNVGNNGYMVSVVFLHTRLLFNRSLSSSPIIGSWSILSEPVRSSWTE